MIHSHWLRSHWILSAALATGQLLHCQSGPPPAAKRPVTDVYHGVKVVDDYRWLEDWSNPEARAWSDAQNNYARKYIDALPGRAALHEQIRLLLSKPSADFGALRLQGGILFAMRNRPPREQPFLVALESADRPDSARVILDPAQVDPAGGTAIDFYVPSHDGKYVAVSLSKGGSESGDVHVYETATGKPLPDAIPRANGGTAGGSLAWNADGSGFYYTRYPRSGERGAADLDFYQQVWFHRIGSAGTADTYSLGKDFPRIAEISLRSSDDGRYVLATMANGDGGEFAHYLLGPDQRWVQVANLADQVISGSFGNDGFLYLLSRGHAPKGKVLKVSLNDPQIAHAKTIVPEGDVSIARLVPGGGRLYLLCVAGGPSEVRIYDRDGVAQGKLPIEENSAVYSIAPYQGEGILFQSASYVNPTAWYRFDPSTRKVSPTGLRTSAAADYSDIAVSREFAVSRDGTKVPMTVLRKKGTPLDGKSPALLTAYGGYGISLPPFFDPTLRPLFDRGVVYAIANLRGGGEYGEDWHRAGSLTH